MFIDTMQRRVNGAVVKYAFISHKNEVEPDMGISQRLYRYLCENNLAVFYDGNLASGDWTEQLSKMIRGASVYIVIASAHSLVSPEVLDEISIMRSERNKRGKRLIPFIIDNYFFNMPASSADYLLGGNRNQAVVLSKFSSEAEAFERLKCYLLQELEVFRNNSDDFEFDGNILKRYTGSDSFVEVPDFVETIADNAFSGNAVMAKVYLPDSVRRIGRMAFMGCGNLLTVEGMRGVCSCEQSAFDRTAVFQGNCSMRLLNGVLFGGSEPCEELVLPEGTRTVADRALVCNEAKRILFPEGLEYIGAYAFRDCYNLTEVEFPRTLKGIAKGGFKGCFMLKKAIFRGALPPNVSESFDNVELEEIES